MGYVAFCVICPRASTVQLLFLFFSFIHLLFSCGCQLMINMMMMMMMMNTRPFHFHVCLLTLGKSCPHSILVLVKGRWRSAPEENNCSPGKKMAAYSYSPVSIQTQSLALRALRKRKPQETQSFALASSQSWLPLLRPSIPAGDCVWMETGLTAGFMTKTKLPEAHCQRLGSALEKSSYEVEDYFSVYAA